MGAIGAALLGKDQATTQGYTNFKGIDLYKTIIVYHH